MTTCEQGIKTYTHPEKVKLNNDIKTLNRDEMRGVLHILVNNKVKVTNNYTGTFFSLKHCFYIFFCHFRPRSKFRRGSDFFRKFFSRMIFLEFSKILEFFYVSEPICHKFFFENSNKYQQ